MTRLLIGLGFLVLTLVLVDPAKVGLDLWAAGLVLAAILFGSGLEQLSCRRMA